ncbi:MAG: succinate--CoA ligase subunit alpha [Desulfotomaculum sp.]|nr:succinate--CoA ligase subunit alpha [Desulfotomaculum sp.]
MAFIINKDTKVMVQGITGCQGKFHTAQMLEYGTEVVAGVTPGKGGRYINGVPVYNTVSEALLNHKIDATIIFVPAPGVKDAALEAMSRGIKTVVIITEHVPLHDELDIIAYARKTGISVIGPNTFGVIVPGQGKIGIMPHTIYKPGPVGIAARSGTLSYEIALNLTQAGFGQSAVIGLGGDRVVGLSFSDVLSIFETDPLTRAVVLVGEIGGNAEEDAAEFISKMNKPVVAFIAGKSAPRGKRMGHAGAIIEQGRGSFTSKVKILSSAGANVAELPWEIPNLVRELLN